MSDNQQQPERRQDGNAAAEILRAASSEAKLVLDRATAEAHTLLRIAQAGQEARVEYLERSMGRIADSLERLSSIDSRLELMDSRQIATLSSVGDHETRVRNIEKEIPVLKLVKGWIITGVVGVFGILVTVVTTLVIRYVGIIA